MSQCQNLIEEQLKDMEHQSQINLISNVLTKCEGQSTGVSDRRSEKRGNEKKLDSKYPVSL